MENLCGHHIFPTEIYDHLEVCTFSYVFFVHDRNPDTLFPKLPISTLLQQVFCCCSCLGVMQWARMCSALIWLESCPGLCWWESCVSLPVCSTAVSRNARNFCAPDTVELETIGLQCVQCGVFGFLFVWVLFPPPTFNVAVVVNQDDCVVKCWDRGYCLIQHP